MGSHPLFSLSHHSYNCGINNCRLGYSYREIMNCEVRVYASNPRSKYRAIALIARVHGSRNEDMVLEDVLLTLILNDSLIKTFCFLSPEPWD